MGKTGKITSLGNLRYDANQVESTSTIKENGATRYVITFKNGATAKFPAQAETNNSSISLAQGTSTSLFSLERISGMEFTGSDKQKELINLSGCHNCTVDVSNDKYKEHVRIIPDQATGTTFTSNNNTVIMDHDVTVDNGRDVIGTCTYHEGDVSHFIQKPGPGKVWHYRKC